MTATNPIMKFLILFSFVFIFNVFELLAVNYHVQPNGNDANNGLSFTTAFKTIQTATNKVAAGDTVFVYNGFYKGFDHFYKNSGSEGHEIVYYAQENQVVINQSCGRGYDGLNIEGSHYIQVIGFKVQRIADPNGSGEDGIRAVLANHITISHCEVDSCYRGIFTGYTDDFLAEFNICKRSYGEHGIYVSNNSDRVVIRYNQCFENARAAGIQLNPDLSSGSPGISTDVKIYNNICYGNRIGLNLQGIYYSEVYNNLIYNNGSGGGGNGITFFLGDAATGCNDVKVYNNTVIVPSASQWCILAIESDSLFVKNNILLSFSAKGCLDIESSCTNYFGDYNLLNDKMTVNQGSSYINFAIWKAMGNDLNSIVINDNASVFKNVTGGDYNLSDNSPAIDAGSSEVAGLVVEDIIHTKRPQAGKFDIGCYEKIATTFARDEVEKMNLKVSDLGDILSFENLTEDQQVMLFNTEGNVLSKGNKVNKRLLLPGMYFYFVFDTKSGTTLGTGKIFLP
ncbi:MAG: hypothetical protein IPM34_12365 [Saprospiraceae bacterium]|nr:hypothetical protein [Saprospiraceae bacterium]